MRKLLLIILTLSMLMSLCACGGETADKSESVGGSESVDSATFTIGEGFGTDNVECVIKEIKWITSEEFENHSSGQSLNIKDMFPSYKFLGVSKISKDSLTDTTPLCVVYSLQNVGKEDVVCGEEPTGDGSYSLLSYGNIDVLYDDGYTFSVTENNKYGGFTSTLKVLSDPITGVMVYSLPNQVFENNEKTLNLKITLPSSNGELEEFIVSIR